MQLPPNVVNTLDTLPTFRSLWPALRSYQLQDLVSEKLGSQSLDKSSFPHDAVSDARALQRLVAIVPPARRFIVQRHLSDEFTLSTGTV